MKQPFSHTANLGEGGWDIGGARRLSRAEAQWRGLTRFFTGRPCKRGHISQRFTSSAGCVKCKQLRDASAAYREKAAQYREANRGAERNRTIVYRITVRMGRPMVAAYDQKACEAIYAACPDGMQVDHIVPLEGDVVSGLHVAWNLQYMTAEQNGLKGKFFDPNAPVHGPVTWSPSGSGVLGASNGRRGILS
ncbi:hypothetical protein [Cupriavidus sp. H39]|uniref:hypothetical protein n=1 Tax=Cupriavidus sp. H39 TaxID=3401635 RepID=UPI003D076462